MSKDLNYKPAQPLPDDIQHIPSNYLSVTNTNQENISGNKDYRRTTATKKDLFLTALARLGTQTKAANASGIARSTVMYWQQEDPEFAEAIPKALQEHCDSLVDEAIRRGKEKSDNLLMFTIKGVRPEYRDNHKVDINISSTHLLASLGDSILAGRARPQAIEVSLNSDTPIKPKT